MLKVILIDDEEPALIHLERLLNADGRVQIRGKYTSAQEGLDHLAGETVDIAFLDIGMPEMNGLQAAERIQTLHPYIRIVYVTAYSAYAVEAFELYALDYLLKPVDAARIGKTLNRIEEYVKLTAHQAVAAADKPEVVITVRCFKRLELTCSSSPGETIKWRTKKAQELFAYLLHLNGAWVAKDKLMEMLWREQPMDKAITYLHHSVSRIRWLLREWQAPCTVEYSDESYRLAATGIQTDVSEFEETVSGTPHNFRDNWSSYEHAVTLYQGEYLEDHNYEWAETKRLNLQQSYFQLICGMARYELEEGRDRSAIQRLLHAQIAFPYSDEICRLLMSGYAQMHNKKMVKDVYEQFKRVLLEELGVIPEPQTTNVYKKLIDGKSQ